MYNYVVALRMVAGKKCKILAQSGEELRGKDEVVIE